MNPKNIVLVVILIVCASILLILFKLQNNKNNSRKNITSKSKIIIANMNKSENIFPEPNEPPYFYVKQNEWVSINDNWNIRLDSIESDNRCPSRMSCATAGRAVAKVQFSQPNVDYYAARFEKLEIEGGNRTPFKPVTIQASDAITGKDIGFKITLVNLLPLPEKEFFKTLPNDYIGLFKIEPLK